MSKPIPLSIWAQHVQRWKSCDACDLCNTRTNVVLGRGRVPCDVVLCGEGPGLCLSGDTLIDTAFRDKSKYQDGVPIRDLVGKAGFLVYSYDEAGRRLALGKVKKVWKTGTRRVYRVSYFWWGGNPGGSGGRHKYYGSIKVTDNHPFLLKHGIYCSIKEGLSVGDRLQPFYRRHTEYHSVGIDSASLVNEARFLLEYKIDRPLEEREQVHHEDRNKWNDQWDNLSLLGIDEHARVHGLEDNPMFDPVHRETHRQVMQSEQYRSTMSKKMKGVFENPEMIKKRREQNRRVAHKTASTVKNKFATDPQYWWKYLMGCVRGRGLSMDWAREKFYKKFPDVEMPPEDNHRIYKIEDAGVEDVYDMEVEKYHNFAANGVFVHNSEDTLGKPFVGPAGKLLDLIISRAMSYGADSTEPRWTYALTNLVSCLPPGADGRKTAEPEEEYILACSGRLREFVDMANPRLLVAVGGVARDWLTPGYKRSIKFARAIPVIDIVHPAHILRSNVAMREIAVQRCVVNVRNAVAEYVLGVK